MIVKSSKTKIRRRKKDSKTKLYFPFEVQESIVAFQNSTCNKEKEKLYQESIYPAFNKLVENLIHVYGFSSSHDSYRNLKSDCVEFLYETINKFDNDRGTKAFSYFNIVAKRWLIIESKNRFNNLKKNLSLSDISLFSPQDVETLENYNVVLSPDDIVLDEDVEKIIDNLLNELEKRLSSSNELLCIKHIRQIFKNVDNIELLGKRAVFLYLREMSGLTSKQLTTALSSIRKKYKEIIKESDNGGLFELF